MSRETKMVLAGIGIGIGAWLLWNNYKQQQQLAAAIRTATTPKLPLGMLIPPPRNADPNIIAGW